MVVLLDDIKRAVQVFVDNDIVPKTIGESKAYYVCIGLLAPKIIDKYFLQYKDTLLLADILREDGGVNLDIAESFLSELLTKLGGFEICKLKICADDIHKIVSYI